MRMTSKEKIKKNAKLGNTVKIYDVVSHRSFYVNDKDLKRVESLFLQPLTYRVHLKRAVYKKTPCNCGYFIVGPKTSKMVKGILDARKEDMKKCKGL